MTRVSNLNGPRSSRLNTKLALPFHFLIFEILVYVVGGSNWNYSEAYPYPPESTLKLNLDRERKRHLQNFSRAHLPIDLVCPLLERRGRNSGVLDWGSKHQCWAIPVTNTSIIVKIKLEEELPQGEKHEDSERNSSRTHLIPNWEGEGVIFERSIKITV